jgi:hypothetical protein
MGYVCPGWYSAGTPVMANEPPDAFNVLPVWHSMQVSSPKSPVRSVGGPPEKASNRLPVQQNTKKMTSDSFQPRYFTSSSSDRVRRRGFPVANSNLTVFIWDSDICPRAELRNLTLTYAEETPIGT